MSIANKPLSQVAEADLLTLIADGEPEGKTLDYKRDPVGRTDADKKEFLYDVSSFANTLGGDLIFGIDEAGGVATNLVGLPNVNADEEILRLEQMARDGIRPPIIGLQSKGISLANGNSAIVMRIPKSWNPPHQVTYQNAFRFYGRASNGKYQLDVTELRSVFSLSTSAAERLKLFRIERVAKVSGGDTPVPLEVGAKMIVHILPLVAFTGHYFADLNRLWRDHSSLVGVLRGGGSPLFNVDGLVLASANRPASRYAQVFRDGCIEVVADWSAEANTSARLPCPAFEIAITEHVYRGKQLLQHIGVTPPLVIMITMIGMKGWRIATQWDNSAAAFDRDPLFIPELVLEAFDGLAQNDSRPLIDAIWNAAGSPGSPT
jgi:hypothetical protein